jgi:hypothetical protein
MERNTQGSRLARSPWSVAHPSSSPVRWISSVMRRASSVVRCRSSATHCRSSAARCSPSLVRCRSRPLLCHPRLARCPSRPVRCPSHPSRCHPCPVRCPSRLARCHPIALFGASCALSRRPLLASTRTTAAVGRSGGAGRSAAWCVRPTHRSVAAADSTVCSSVARCRPAVSSGRRSGGTRPPAPRRCHRSARGARSSDDEARCPVRGSHDPDAAGR